MNSLAICLCSRLKCSLTRLVWALTKSTEYWMDTALTFLKSVLWELSICFFCLSSRFVHSSLLMKVLSPTFLDLAKSPILLGEKYVIPDILDCLVCLYWAAYIFIEDVTNTWPIFKAEAKFICMDDPIFMCIDEVAGTICFFFIEVCRFFIIFMLVYAGATLIVLGVLVI